MLGEADLASDSADESVDHEPEPEDVEAEECAEESLKHVEH